MRNFSRYLFIFLSVAMGALFLYSAYTKLYPIQSFEYTMVEFVHMPWMLAAIAARILIALEGGLGILMVAHFFGAGKWVLKTAFALLGIFSVYLIYLWATAGNDVNCGCFGDAIWMSPSASLIKNAIMLIITGLLIRYHKGFTGSKWYNISAPLILIACTALMFILFALPAEQPNWLRKDRYEIDFSEVGIENGSSPHVLYAPGSTDTATIDQIDLLKGKYIIAFLSQSCPHCRIAAYKMHLLQQSNPHFRFFMIIGGSSDLTEFWKATKAVNIPYVRLDKDHFLHYTGGVFPLIEWVNNGWVEAKAEYTNMNKEEIERWLTPNAKTPNP
ncbi:MAG: DoxX protein [Flavipsychrobacter sp.]|nr:DoxX protein [Flavipsychrobacter sp.]